MDGSGFQYQDLLNQSVIASGTLIVDTIIFPNLDINSIPYIDSNNTVDDLVLNDGEIIIGKTGAAPLAGQINGTTNQVNVVNGSGSINLSLPQDIATSSSPTFDNMTLNSLNNVPVSDYIITPSTSDLDMDNHNISNLSSLNGTLVSNYLKTPSTVDLDMNNHFISNFNSLRPLNSNLNIGNTTSMPVSSFGTINIGDLTTSLGDSSVNIGLQNIARTQSVSIGKETTAGARATVIGYRSSSGISTDSCVYGHDNVSQATNADIFGINRTNNQANSLLLGNGSYTNIRANSTCDLGTSSIPFQSIYSNGTLYGTTNNRLVNDIVSNSGSGTLNNIVSFNSDKVIKDSGIPSSQITTNTSNIATNTANIATNTANISTNTANIATNTANISTNTSNISILQTKTQNQSATAGNTNFTGILQQAGVNVATVADLGDYVERSGDSMTGTLNMTTNNITNIGTLSGSTNSRTADNILSCNTNPAYGRIAMFSNNNKVLEDSTYSVFDVVSGPASATDNNLASYNLTTGKLIKDSGIASGNVVLKTGTTMSGDIAMDGNNITNAGAISIGTSSINAQIQLSNSIVNRKVILYESFANDHQFHGFGVNSGVLRYQISSTANSHVFFAGSSSTTSSELMRLTGAGNLQLGTSATATARLVVSGGVNNVGTENSCIRATSSSSSTKIEIQNTSASGRLYELRSSSFGIFDITDRTGSATRFTIDTAGNVGIGMTPVTGGGNNNNLQIANGAGPTGTPTGGGCLYVNAGRLFFKGGSGTVTQLANA